MNVDPIVGVLALQGDVREHLAALAECDVIARPVRRAAEIAAVDALVIPGGESTTMSNLVDVFGVRDVITERIAAGMPAYGSCAGMIMLARTVLDGRPDQRGFDGIDVVVRRNAFGRQVDSFEAPVELAGVEGGPLHAVFIRAPWVESVGPGVEVLGRVAVGAAAGGAGGAGAGTVDGSDGRIVAIRQRRLLATSFHPELTGDLRVHRLFVEMVRAATGTTED
ncbi:pyridoxal 5'-phosphate synthase subunit PdxT [Pilimelia anulata]|uniref:Pyridoxal 5'-phosphate synthase subunit PdxT n=1 Tax=Pilimelia anulata TaxID=53371 RepID=A0A8J3F887_9ACTN|nr:pyridoxal 5'-phosphate synthase glutaminase subunit PdxT [Pilimelia anulata]GGJ86229.1 pyridoxal 5'-phosphate synthase subunit PdxT [Pilimelia anulata]